MANKKISELTSLPHLSMSGDDVALIVDVNSDGTGLPETKKTTLFELSRYLSSVGGAGSGNAPLKNVTTNNAPTELFMDGISEPFYLGDNETIGFDIQIVGRRIDIRTENCYFTVSGLVTRGTGNASISIIGTPTINVISRPNTNWAVSVDANTVNGSLRLKVTGESGKTISWLSVIRFVEISG